MDLFGFCGATLLLIATFALFELAVRMLGDAVGSVRYSVAPSMLNGLRAWVDEHEHAAATPVEASAPVGGAGGAAREDGGDALLVAIGPVRR